MAFLLLPSGSEWIIVIALVILLFGASAIPKLARGLGQAKGEFTKAKNEFEAEMGKAEAGQHTAASEQQIRATARDLGIEEEGRSLEDVKKDVQAKLG